MEWLVVIGGDVFWLLMSALLVVVVVVCVGCVVIYDGNEAEVMMLR